MTLTLEGHYYIVRRALVRTTVALRVTASLVVECFAANRRMACHASLVTDELLHSLVELGFLATGLTDERARVSGTIS